MHRKKLTAKKPITKKPATKKPAALSPFDDTARQARMTACQEALTAVLKKHDCRLEAQTLIQGERVRALVVLVANAPPS